MITCSPRFPHGYKDVSASSPNSDGTKIPWSIGMATLLGRELRLRHHGCVNDEFEAKFLESPLTWSEIVHEAGHGDRLTRQKIFRKIQVCDKSSFPESESPERQLGEGGGGEEKYIFDNNSLLSGVARGLCVFKCYAAICVLHLCLAA